MEQNNKKEVKPIEFVIYKTDGSKFYIKFWYSDGTSDEKEIDGVPNLIPINKHYALTEIKKQKELIEKLEKIIIDKFGSLDAVNLRPIIIDYDMSTIK